MVDSVLNSTCRLFVGSWMYCLYDFYGNWSLGIEQNRWLGLGYHKLRLVGRYWSRGNSYFCCAFTLPSKMENGDQPFCRSDDHFLCCSGRFIPVNSYGASLVGLLGSANSKPIRIFVGEL